MEDFKQQIEELKNIITSQGEKLEAQADELKKLTASPEKKGKVKPKTPKATFTMDGKKYRFALPEYIIPGKGKVASADMLKNTAELERLVSINSGVIKRVGK